MTEDFLFLTFFGFLFRSSFSFTTSIFLLFDACLASSSLSSDDVARTMSYRVSDLEVDTHSSCSFPAVGVVSGTSTVSRFENFVSRSFTLTASSLN